TIRVEVERWLATGYRCNAPCATYRPLRSGLLLYCCGNCATIAALGRGGVAWRRKRHGAPNCEPSKICPVETGESLRPVRGDDLHAGMVRVPGPAPGPAPVGMRSVRLQVRDVGLLP